MGLAVLAFVPQAQAAGVPIACTNAVSGVNVTEGDTVDLGISAGCSFVSVSASGNLEPLSQTSYLAFAAGSGSLMALVRDTDGIEYVNRINVSIAAQPTPTPTPTPTQSTSPTPTPSASASPSAGGSASSSPTPSLIESAGPTYDLSNLQPAVAPSTKPAPSQQLVKSDIATATNAGPGNVVIESDNGNPLQLLEVRGDAAAFDVVSAGIDYANPANWQRLGYGDLCWSYSGYEDMQAVILPIADPPFATVVDDWDLASAILVTKADYATFVGPSPGDVVNADGAIILSVIICGKAAQSPELAPRFAAANPQNRVTICHKPGTPAQMTKSVNANSLDGHLGHGDYIGACSVAPTIVLPTLPPTTATTSTPTPTPMPTTTPAPTSSPSPTSTPDQVLSMCRATGDAANPYVKDSIPLSQVPQPPRNSGPYPQAGWTSVIAPAGNYPGQNWTGWGQDLLNADCAITPPTPVVTPTPSPSPSATPTPTPTPTPTAVQGPILTWPPLVPVKTDYPVKAKYVVPTPYPTPTPTATATPTISPSPNPTFTVTPEYVVPPRVPQPTPTPTPTSTNTSTATPTPAATPSPNPTYTIISGTTAPPIPFPKPTVTPEVVAPTQGPNPVFTPVILAPTQVTTEQQAAGDIPADSKVTLVLSNGPSTVEVTTSVNRLTREAISAGEPEAAVTELAATGELRRSGLDTWRYERAQAAAAKSWPDGDSLARLSWRSQRSGAQRTFYIMDDVTKERLRAGPGWYPTTARPGESGNTAIAGHRLGYGDPFEHLDELQPGDQLALEVPGSSTRAFQVVDSFLVNPEDTWVLGPDILRNGTDTLTLTTCDPPGVNTQRLVVVARALAS